MDAAAAMTEQGAECTKVHREEEAQEVEVDKATPTTVEETNPIDEESSEPAEIGEKAVTVPTPAAKPTTTTPPPIVKKNDGDDDCGATPATPATPEMEGEKDSSSAEADDGAQAASMDSSTDVDQDQDSDEEQAAGAPPRDGLPSLGSAAHLAGGCTPCCFFVKNRCRNGEGCQFCHLPHEKRSRGRGCRGHGGAGKKLQQQQQAVAAVAGGAGGPPGLLQPPPGLELLGAPAPPARSFLSTQAPSAAAFATPAPPPAAYLSLPPPDASSRPVSAAMALGLSSPPGHHIHQAPPMPQHPPRPAAASAAMALGLTVPPGQHHLPHHAAAPPRLATTPTAPPAADAAARRPLPAAAAPGTAMFSTSPLPPPGAAAPRLAATAPPPPGAASAADGASLPRLLGGRSTRTQGPPAPQKEATGQPRAPPEGVWGPAPLKVAVAELSGTALRVDPTAPLKKRVPDWAI